MRHYSPSLIANAFLYKAKDSGVKMTHMKLQKLVFFVHAWSLAINDQSMVSEKPEAWQYGPVFDSLYHELKQHGSNFVDKFLVQMNSETGERQALVPAFNDKKFWALLDQVWDRYSKLTAMQLSALTHESGGPWETARQKSSGWLDDNEVATHYKHQLTNAK